jgi:hypothetical protein
MSFTELFGAGSQTTIVIALVSLMGASLSIAFAMAMAISYLDKPMASKRQIVLSAATVLVGFYVVITWPEDEPTVSLKSEQRLSGTEALAAFGIKKGRIQ